MYLRAVGLLSTPCKKPPPEASTNPAPPHCSLPLGPDSPRRTMSVSEKGDDTNKRQTCIPSVIAHHSRTLGFSRIRRISPSKSLPTYLNVAKRVRSLSKKMESSRLVGILSLSTALARRTVLDVAVFDLLQYLWPDVGVAVFVGLDGGGLEVHDLGEAAGWGHFVTGMCSFLNMYFRGMAGGIGLRCGGTFGLAMQLYSHSGGFSPRVDSGGNNLDKSLF